MTIPLIEPPVQSLRLADGRTLEWYEFGDPEGRPALYFHGGSSIGWEAGIFHREAVAHRIRLISTNRPGAGRTSLKPGRPIAGYADDLAELLDHLGLGQVACFGESNGGATTLAIASGLAGRIVGAAPINPTLPWSDPLARRVSAWNARIGYWILNFPRLCTRAAHLTAADYRRRVAAGEPKGLFGPPPGTEADVAEILVRMAETSTIERVRPELAWARSDWGFDYYNIPTRLDLFCGVHDYAAPFSLILADRNPDAQFHYFAHGHHGFVHPDARRRIVETVAGYFDRA